MRHDCHEEDGSKVGRFTGHVAAGDDLEAGLRGGVDIVGDKVVAVDLFTDWVTAGFDGKGGSVFGPDIVLDGTEVGEGTDLGG